MSSHQSQPKSTIFFEHPLTLSNHLAEPPGDSATGTKKSFRCAQKIVVISHGNGIVIARGFS
jgi:hypothetical protein